MEEGVSSGREACAVRRERRKMRICFDMEMEKKLYY